MDTFQEQSIFVQIHMIGLSRKSQRRAAVSLLVLMALGGMTCPCSGIHAVAVSQPGSDDCGSHSCCEGCRKETPTPKPVELPHDCNCLSGCCAPYLLPAESISIHDADSVHWVYTAAIPVNQPLFEIVPPLTGWFPDTRFIHPPGTLMPGLSTLLI